MLIVSRQRGESMMVGGPPDGCLITVVQIRGEQVSLLFSHSPPTATGQLESWTASLVRDGTVKVGDTVEVTVVDIRGDRVRLGVVAPKEFWVHRIGADDDGLAGSRIPRLGGPKPPALEVRLDEPHDEERDQTG